MERNAVHFQVPTPGRWGSHFLKPISTSQWRQRFFERGKGNRTKRSRKGVEKFFPCRQAQYVPIRQVRIWCASSWFSHPGSTSPQLHAILGPWLKVSKPLRAGMPERQSLYLLKLVPTILIQTCCLSSSYILVSQHVKKQCQKNGVVGYNSPPLHNHCAVYLKLI